MSNKIAECIKSYANKFEQVAERAAHAVASGDYKNGKYTILNYKKILDEIVSFIDGYVEYAQSGEEKYKGKVLSTTVGFYEQMFEEGGKKYRIPFELTDFKETNKAFLQGTKTLQQKIDSLSGEEYEDNRELHSLISLTENQFRKIAKVFNDDMTIYIWLTSLNVGGSYSISSELRADFNDKTTPVIHKK